MTPELLPQKRWFAALFRVKVRAGVVEALATDVLNSGVNNPALKVVTVPDPELPAGHGAHNTAVPSALVCRHWLMPIGCRRETGSVPLV